ncbi:betaine-aldehyde dehydrogenase [Wenxinia marina]|uniref:Betaine-aldehyde dehydrogenase n=1 Tax=Wenxinia marina DSM 24838 TaxID=1123501 RepID=A0A0D0QCN9_9RHOB|nr:betaine-aldehyde dehydrogenase [Wenxinia marina]KIQ68688.1 betaine aldehyde dehydrogenase [Wenxinia marina DSM 24838]GGL67930.1 NAD/NADP-dependent betaine aldehyde dehydrogenase [Wenxinia marina]
MAFDIRPAASHFVNGQPVEDEAGTPIPVICPVTGDEIARVHAATPAVIEDALASAEAAQKDWAAMMPRERGAVLKRAAAIIRERNRELSVLESRDTGKPLSETLVADATSGADALDFFGGLAATLTGEHIPLGGDWAYTIREPLGVCVGIGAWNYPTQIACWKAAPALACGNAMVFKPSETTPLGALKLAEILVEAGAPPGLFNVVQGAGEVGAALIADARVAKVSLTGSVPTGKRVYAAAAAGMKHVTMELGGKSPILVFDDADVENAVTGAILGNFYSSGQICSNGTRVFVQSGIKERFLERLAERLESGVVMGDPLDEATNYGPMVSERQMEIVLGYIEKGREEGARLIAGGGRVDRPGFFVAPTVFADVTDDMTIAREEIFGPVLSVLDFEDEADAVARANATEFGLAAGVYTSDLARGHRVVAALRAGTCWINAYNLTPVEMPFGGVKSSGVGRENGRAAIEHYSQLKSVYVAMGASDAPF